MSAPSRLAAIAAAHWAGAAAGELRLPYSPSTGRFWYPPTRLAPGSLAADVEWRPVDGRGRITGWCVFHRAYFPNSDLPVPYTVILVKLDAGPQLYGNLVDQGATPVIGALVEPVFVPVGEGEAIVRFKTVDA